VTLLVGVADATLKVFGRPVPTLPEVVPFQNAIQRLCRIARHADLGRPEMRLRSEWVFRTAAHEAVERRKGLGVPDFVWTTETHLTRIVLISDDPVPQVRGKTGFNVVQQGTGHYKLFIHESW